MCYGVLYLTLASMRLKFTKMHGLGNDFMVVDATRNRFALSETQIRQLADRHFGVGFDQLLVVEPPASEQVDFTYRIFNADGGEVEQCGNGARCFARFVREKGLTDKRSIRVATAAGVLTLTVDKTDQVLVNMGVPCFAPAQIPLAMAQQQSRYTIDLNNQTIEFGALSLGNPHAVIEVDDVDNCGIETLGPMLESLSLFPQRVNVGFMQVIDRGHIRLRVYERGAGETLACGSGACAAAVIARLWQKCDKTIKVSLPGGDLTIYLEHDAENADAVFLNGPASFVFEGQLQL